MFEGNDLPGRDAVLGRASGSPSLYGVRPGQTRRRRDHRRPRARVRARAARRRGRDRRASPTRAQRGRPRSCSRGSRRQGIPLLRGSAVVRAVGRRRVTGAVVAELDRRRPRDRGHRARHRLRPGRRLRRHAFRRPRCCCRPAAKARWDEAARRLRPGAMPRRASTPPARSPATRRAADAEALGRGRGSRGRALARARRASGPRAARGRARRPWPAAPSAVRPRPPAAAGDRPRRTGSASPASARTSPPRTSASRSTRASTRSSCSKRYTTVTMGPCQGRMCQLAAIRADGRGHRARPSTRSGMTTARPPWSSGADGRAGGPAVRAREALGGPRAPPRARRQRAVGRRLAPAVRLRRSRGRDDGRARGRRPDRRLDARQADRARARTPARSSTASTRTASTT